MPVTVTQWDALLHAIHDQHNTVTGLIALACLQAFWILFISRRVRSLSTQFKAFQELHGILIQPNHTVVKLESFTPDGRSNED